MMKRHCFVNLMVSAMVCVVALLKSAGAYGQEGLPILEQGVEVTTVNGRSSLNRATGKLSSEVTVKVKNTGDRPLLPPLHAALHFTATNGGSLAGLTVMNVLGEMGQEPYQTVYRDLSSAIGTGLAAGAETIFAFTFERPAANGVTYSVLLHGTRNRDPQVVIGGPYAGQAGEPIAFDATGTSDPDGDALAWEWDFGDGAIATGATAQHGYTQAGLYTVTLMVTDARGAVVVREAQVPVSPPGDFALARRRHSV